MAWPANERPPDRRGQRVILRRLRGRQDVAVEFALVPRRNFAAGATAMRPAAGGAVYEFADGSLLFWASFAAELYPEGAHAHVQLRAGDEHWVVLGWNTAPEQWDVAGAAQVFEAAENYWRDWSSDLAIEHGGSRLGAIRRSALTVQLLSHAHHSSAVAALTTSLPERLGGDRNYDYRYAWVRDASLSLALLARLGKSGQVRCYLEWLCGLHSSTSAPLQVCYRLDGNPHIDQHTLSAVSGYAHSQPVVQGNRAAKQIQLGSFGFFADCARIYLDHGGEWREEFWSLLKCGADYTCKHWQDKDSGIWELTQHAQYVASRVMSWVTLERSIYIAHRTGHAAQTDHWREISAAIHDDVMDQGWCEEKQSFRQRYGSDALDAAALLIPLMDFLPIDHPRVTGTFAAIERELVIDGLMHRFDPTATLGGRQLPIGEFEGAFLPCVFWHAHALAKAGRCAAAEAILAKCEAISGETGLFAEEAQASDDTFLGNTPLLFAHVAYVRAVMALNEARARTVPTESDRKS
jgi:GH15 family glucan-1,4-alpha-glucosidase